MIDTLKQGTLWPDLEIRDSALEISEHLAPRSNKFLHYCSLPAFYSIMESGRLRFTSAKSTNDPSEFVFGQDVVRQALRAASSRHGRGPADALIQAEERFSNSDFQAFVFCMSESDPTEAAVGELSQWRLYGSDGRGVALVFDVSAGTDRSLLSKLGSIPRRVTYGEVEGQVVVGKIIDDYLEKLTALGSAAITPKRAQEGLLNAIYWLPSMIKHLSYQHEREIRLVRGDIGEEYGNQLVFFERGSIQRPAIERDISERVGEYPSFRHESPIKGVIIGPSGDQAAIYDSIKYWLAARGWELSISRSDIPYRAVS